MEGQFRGAQYLARTKGESLVLIYRTWFCLLFSFVPGPRFYYCLGQTLLHDPHSLLLHLQKTDNALSFLFPKAVIRVKKRTQ